MPRTVEHRFSRHNGLHRGADGITRDSETFTYESGKALYDIIVIAGLQFVSVNMGKKSNMISDWTPHHYAIAAHFNL